MSGRDLFTTTPAPAPAATPGGRLAELQAEAALTGRTLGRVCQARVLAALDRTQAQGSGVWRQMSPTLRALLLTTCTNRPDPTEAALQPWGSLTEAERQAIGSTARAFLHELRGATWLRA